MKNLKRHLVFIISLCVFLSGRVEAIERLVLHFDINKTLIASDRLGHKSIKDVINHLLAEKYESCWDEKLAAPLSYRDFVYQVLVPGDEHDSKLKKERKKYLDQFVDFLSMQSHPLYPMVYYEYKTAYAKLKSSKTNVFSSFYKLLEFLDSKKIPYSIILRSFGHELEDVAREINETLKKEFFKLRVFFQNGILHTNDNILKDPQSIYKYITQKGNIVVQDDWKWWHSHQERSEYGKPFYIRQNDPLIIQIFFDDNIKTDDDDFVNVIAPIDSETGLLLKSSDVIESKQAVRVNTLQAILDDHYFIDRVNETIHFFYRK